MCNDFFGFSTQSFTMPIHFIFDLGKITAFVRLGKDHCWLAFSCLGLIEGLHQFCDVVTVNDNGVEPERLHALSVLFHVMLKGSGITLTQTVDINDGAEVVQFVETGKIDGFPNVALHGLTVAHEAVGTVGGLVNEFTDIGHTASHA